MRRITIFILLLWCQQVWSAETSLVPNAETAIKIAIAIWSPIYGEKNIKNKAPYKTVLLSGIWYVEGSLPEGYKGGVPLIQIKKSNSQVIKVSHGK